MQTSSNPNNPVVVLKTSGGYRTINLHLTTNPYYVKLNDEIPGRQYDARVTHLDMTMNGGATKPELVQVDFGEAVRSNHNTTFGCMPSAIQVPVSQKISVPITFVSNKCPQSFKIGVYGPGEPGALLVFDSTYGCNLTIQYQYIAE